MILGSVDNNRKAAVKQKAALVGQKLMEEVEAYGEISSTSPVVTTNASNPFRLLDGGIIKFNSATTRYELMDDPTTTENDCIRAVTGEVNGTKYNIELTLTKDSNINYSSTNNKAIYDSSDEKIEISKLGASITAKLNSNGSNGNIGTDIRLILKDSTVEIYNNGSTTPIITSSNSLAHNKLGIYINDLFAASTLNINVESSKSQTIDVYVVKNSSATGAVTVSPIIGKLIVHNSLKELEENPMGQFYKLNVKVYEAGKTEVLFEGNSSTNINIK